MLYPHTIHSYSIERITDRCSPTATRQTIMMHINQEGEFTKCNRTHDHEQCSSIFCNRKSELIDIKKNEEHDVIEK